MGDISPNLGKYWGLVVRYSKGAGHAFGCFKRVVMWFGVFVSTRQVKAAFNRSRAFYGYRWGIGRKGGEWKEETPSPGAII